MEILFGEGGSDSKAFVSELASIYIKYATRENLSVEILHSDIGHIILEIKGKDALSLFKNEHGCHVVNRRQINEGVDKKHTSLVNVCITELPPAKQVHKLLPIHELEITYARGHGPGGQNVNKVNSKVRVVHRRTGTCTVINGRDQHRNKADAIRIVSAKVGQMAQEVAARRYQAGKVLLGKGGRAQSAKIRTYNFIKGLIVDHRTGKKVRDIKGILKGNLRLLH